MREELRPIPVGQPEVVYHYTTVDTMMKIVTSGKIWATSISYLNDSSEGEHFLRMVRRRLPDLLGQYQLRDAVLTELGDTVQPVEKRPFIASFSTEGDSLPQWRSYCPQGNGVAIGFRVSCLTRAKRARHDEKHPRGVRFRSVEYTADDTPELDGCIADIMRETDEDLAMAKGLFGPDFTLPREHLFTVYAESEACRRKHASFIAEGEYRLITDPLYTQLKDVEFRPVRSALVPYVELSIPDMSLLKMDYHEAELCGEFGMRGGYRKLDFVAKVVVGPTTNMELTIEAVRAFFRKLDLDVRVVPSSSPFRDW